jgi:putative ABC transport system ATP-binding protein
MRIVARDLTRLYGSGKSRITAVNRANLEIEEGKLTVIVGPSGSGKTTLLNLIGLMDQSTSGRIFFDAVDVSLLSNSERRKIRLSRIGFVFQTFNLMPTLNVLENVELPMALAGKVQTEQRRRATMLLETVGLRSKIHSRPRELSAGETQRVAIARALANDPETIIADEPTGELDGATAEEITTMLSNINKREKKTVIVATHDTKIVKAAHRIYTIHDGTLQL